MKLRKLFLKLDKSLARLEKWLVVLFLAWVLVLSFFQIILRNVFSSGWIWSDLLSRQLVVWLGFLAASLATHERKHIKIDLLARFLGSGGRIIFDRLIPLATGLITFFLAKASWSLMIMEKEGGSFLMGPIPSWVFLSILPVSFGLIVFHSLIQTVLGAQETP